MRRLIIFFLVMLPVLGLFEAVYIITNIDEGTYSLAPTFIYQHPLLIILTPLLLDIISTIFFWCILVFKAEFIHFQLRGKLNHSGLFVLAIFMIGLILLGFNLWWQSYKKLSAKNTFNRIARYSKNTEELNFIYRALDQSKDPRFDAIFINLAGNKNASVSLLQNLFNQVQDASLYRKKYILLALAGNNETPPNIITSIYQKFNDSQLMENLAKNPNLNIKYFNQLATYPHCEIRYKLIYNPGLPTNILRYMSLYDVDIGVREAAQLKLNSHYSNNPNKPAQATKQALPINYFHLRNMIPSLENEIALNKVMLQIEEQGLFYLLPLIAKNCYIAPATAASIFSFSQSLPSYLKVAILTNLASNRGVPPTLLNQLANLQELRIVRELAKNPAIDTNTINKLINYPDCRVRKNLIQNKALSETQLKQMAKDTDLSVKIEIQKKRENFYANKQTFMQDTTCIK